MDNSPKNENSIIFYPPQVVPNLYELLYSVEHKRRYFEECCFLGPIEFHSIFFIILCKGTSNCLAPRVMTELNPH